MPFQGDELYRNQDQILTTMLAAWQAAVPDVWIGEDGNLRILLEIESGSIEGVYLANQLLLENVFVQSANLIALQRHGDQFGVNRKIGVNAIGQLLFTGQGGTYINIGAEVAYDPGGGQDPLYFITTQDGLIPNPGVPMPPPVAVAGSGTNLVAGTYEYAIAYLTAQGETLPSDPSSGVVLASAGAIDVTLPLGGPGTTGREIYRSLNGGLYQLVGEVTDNTTVLFHDNVAAPISSEVPVTISTAEQLLLNAQSEETGVELNAVPGSITVLVNVPDGITDVTNPAPFVGGTDEEDIDDYRTRILNTLRSPASGSPTDIKNWAEAINGVESATVFANDNLGTPTPGHVTVRISGPNGTVPGTPVINAVAADLAARDIANITIHVTTFTQSALAVTATIVAATNYVHADLVPSAQLAIQNYIASVPVGGTVYISGIIQYVREIIGVADVTVSVPASNQTAAVTTKFIPGTITIL